MLLNINPDLPAVELLQKENISILNSEHKTDIGRTVRLLILNLMPVKVTTETDILRLLSNSPLNIQIDFLRMQTHQSKNTPFSHLSKYYKVFSQIENNSYDGMIITGAPVEHIDFEQVNYWRELTNIFDWARMAVRSVFNICWAAQAALYYHYGIPKYPLDTKMFGVFEHKTIYPQKAIFRGHDDVFYVPHSRYTEVRAADIQKVDELTVLSYSEEAGVYMVEAHNGREFFITGHSEYAPYTLDAEYKRDLSKGLTTKMPQNYYLNDHPENQPLVRWRSHANLLFINWLNEYVL